MRGIDGANEKRVKKPRNKGKNLFLMLLEKSVDKNNTLRYYITVACESGDKLDAK